MARRSGTYVEIVCALCGVPAEKLLSAVNVSKRKGKPIYCGQSCAGKAQRRSFVCSVEGCLSTSFSKGLCQMHYARLRRHGDVGEAQSTTGKLRAFAEGAAGYIGDDCLIWPFSRGTHGYGRLSINGKSIGAHRYVCMLAHGLPVNDTLEAAHSCGNGHKGCVSPRHLRWATHKENHSDRRAHGTNNFGENCGNAQLSERDVIAIRDECKSRTRSYSSIGRDYGVSEATVRHVVNKDTWRHL